LKTLDRHNVNDQPNQSLAKALLVLEAFTTDKPEWGIRELGRALDINPTSIFRIMSTYLNAGYLVQNPDTQRYSLGPRVMKLASLYLYLNPLPDVALRVFQSHTSQFGYNFYLGTLNKNEMIYLAALDGRGPIKIAVEPGGSAALHATALGKILLAYQDDAYIRSYVEETPLPAYTPRSITDPARLWDMIREVRQQDFAINDGELYGEVGAVGVPLFDRTGRVTLGISLAYPRHLVQEGRIDPRQLIPLAREIAAEISTDAGLSR
jgi:DNA-binding IclR family transcriptional regulator